MLSISQEHKEKIKTHLRNLVSDKAFLEGLLLSTSDGRLIAFANYSRQELEKSRLAAMAASLSGLSITLAKSCSKTGVIGGAVETEDGLIISSLLSTSLQEFVLLGIFAKNTQHGMALWNFRKYKKDFDAIFNNFTTEG